MKFLNLLSICATISVLCACGSDSDKKAITVSGVDITSKASRYYEVVDGIYTIENVDGVLTTSITLKKKEDPYDYSSTRPDGHNPDKGGKIYGFHDPLVIVLLKGSGVEVGYKLGADAEKLEDLLYKCKKGSTKSITFTGDYSDVFGPKFGDNISASSALNDVEGFRVEDEVRIGYIKED